MWQQTAGRKQEGGTELKKKGRERVEREGQRDGGKEGGRGERKYLGGKADNFT